MDLSYVILFENSLLKYFATKKLIRYTNLTNNSLVFTENNANHPHQKQMNLF